MKTIRLFLTMMVMFTMAMTVSAQKANKTVVFNVKIDCNNCKAKIEKNIPYEKGVKDLKVDMEANTVTVTFREDKNTIKSLQKALETQGIPVKGYKEVDAKEVKKEPKAKKKSVEATAIHQHKPGGACCDKH